MDQGETQRATAPTVAVVGTPGQGVQGETVIEEPGKLLRIASMLRELIEEVQRSPLDEGGRARLANIYRRSVDELAETLTDDLRAELAELLPPLGEAASDSEVRVAQAQLLGWLEGLFHGIQAALWTQQMQARAALEEMRRRSLPSGSQPPAEEAQREGPTPPGQYL
jgi:hypothetical protein